MSTYQSVKLNELNLPHVIQAEVSGNFDKVLDVAKEAAISAAHQLDVARVAVHAPKPVTTDLHIHSDDAYCFSFL